MLITLRGGELRHCKQEKDYLRRFPECRTFGRTAGRPAGRGFSARFCSVAPHLLSYSEVGDDGKAGTAVGYGR